MGKMKKKHAWTKRSWRWVAFLRDRSIAYPRRNPNRSEQTYFMLNPVRVSLKLWRLVTILSKRLSITTIEFETFCDSFAHLCAQRRSRGGQGASGTNRGGQPVRRIKLQCVNGTPSQVAKIILTFEPPACAQIFEQGMVNWKQLRLDCRNRKHAQGGSIRHKPQPPNGPPPLLPLLPPPSYSSSLCHVFWPLPFDRPPAAQIRLTSAPPADDPQV
jgi:hypothetical protein